MPNTTHGSVSEHVVGKGTVFGEAVGDYREEKYMTEFEIEEKIPKFKASAKILKRVDHLWIRLLLVRKRQTQKTPATDYSERKEKSPK